MSDATDIAVRVQVLDGQWETLGRDRYAGITPEGVRLTHNAWGPDTASFTLRRDPGAAHLDLATWTPIEVEVAGRPSWDGRLKETPSQDGDDPQISVQAEGWQYHLDDDVYERKYVHTRLADWKDQRSLLGANLALFTVAPQVQSGDGGVVLSLQAGLAVVAGVTTVGVTLDLGRFSTAAKIAIDWESSNNDGGASIVARTHSTEDASAGGNDAFSGTLASGASGSTVGNFTTPARYVTLFVQHTTTGTLTADVWFRLRAIRVFTDNAYEAGMQSVLTADVIVNDALDRATVKLSADRSGIQAGTFPIPEFALDGAKSPREVLTGANAYENYELRMALGRKLIFRPRPTAAVHEVGEWRGCEFKDASANSGEEIYNRVSVEATGPDGSSLGIERATAGPPWKAAPEVTVPNSGFEVNASGWTVTDGALARDTTVSQTGAASGRGTTAGTVFNMKTLCTGLLPGRSYALSVGVRRATALFPTTGVVITVDLDGQGHYADQDPSRQRLFHDADLPLGAFVTVEVPFVALAASQEVNFFVETTGSNVVAAYFDNLQLVRSNATLVDRQDFRRSKILQVQSALTDAAAARVGELYLDAHRTTPFRGEMQVTGDGGVRRVLGGDGVHPAHLQSGDLIRCAHRADPDTGGWGRDGRAATIAYDHDPIAATVALDDDRGGFEALLSQLSVVVGQVQG